MFLKFTSFLLMLSFVSPKGYCQDAQGDPFYGVDFGSLRPVSSFSVGQYKYNNHRAQGNPFDGGDFGSLTPVLSCYSSPFSEGYFQDIQDDPFAFDSSILAPLLIEFEEDTYVPQKIPEDIQALTHKDTEILLESYFDALYDEENDEIIEAGTINRVPTVGRKRKRSASTQAPRKRSKRGESMYKSVVD